jgi:hypothetical protein
MLCYRVLFGLSHEDLRQPPVRIHIFPAMVPPGIVIAHWVRIDRPVGQIVEGLKREKLIPEAAFCRVFTIVKTSLELVERSLDAPIGADFVPKHMDIKIDVIPEEFRADDVKIVKVQRLRQNRGRPPSAMGTPPFFVDLRAGEKFAQAKQRMKAFFNNEEHVFSYADNRELAPDDTPFDLLQTGEVMVMVRTASQPVSVGSSRD